MKIKHIDHIGIAVKSIEQAGKFYTDILGLRIEGIENVSDQKVNVAFIPITDSEVELLESTDSDGPVAKYIDSRGEGVQHIAFRVENIEDALSETIISLQKRGVIVIGLGLETERMSDFFRVNCAVYNQKDLIKKFAKIYCQASAASLET